MKKSVFSGVCVVVGSVVGAGFATGRELFLFFYNKNILVAAILCFAFFAVSIAAVCINRGNYILNGSKLAALIDATLMGCYFVVLGTMLAASNSTLSMAFGTNPRAIFFAAIFAVICGVSLHFGFNGIKAVNMVAVPLVVVFVVVLFGLCGGSTDGFTVQPDFQLPIRSAGYVGLNLMLMFCVLTDLGKQYSYKQIKQIALLSSLLLCGLIVIILIIISGINGIIGDMPLLALAKEKGQAVYVLGIIAVLLSSTTSLQCSAYPLVKWQQSVLKDKFSAIMIVMIAALFFSLAGFVNIVNYAYPLVSVLGVTVLWLVSKDNRKNAGKNLSALLGKKQKEDRKRKRNASSN